MAKIYGSILAETGFLSRGEVILTKPADYLGLNSGESMSKTKAIMERAKGNVLVIDEAYGLKGLRWLLSYMIVVVLDRSTSFF